MRRLALVAPLLLALGGCGDDDGTSPFAPTHGIAGTWVRYQPPPRAADPVALTAGFADTLELDAEGRGRWSRIMLGGVAGVRRVAEEIVLLAKGPVVELRPRLEPCPACNQVDPSQFLAPFLVIRTSADRLEIRRNLPPRVMVFDEMVMVGGNVAYYERRASAPQLEE